MKLLSLAVSAILAMAPTAIADGYTLGVTCTLTGVSANPNNTPCIKIFQDAAVAAWAEALPNDDSQLVSFTVTSVTSGFATALRSATMGTVSYSGTGSYNCRRCRRLQVLNTLQLQDSEALFETTLASKLKTSTCAAYNKLESVDCTFLPGDVLAEQSVELVADPMNE